jgi:hypothetical protein
VVRRAALNISKDAEHLKILCVSGENYKTHFVKPRKVDGHSQYQILMMMWNN